MAQADTINDRLLNQNTLSGPAQEQLAGRKLREDRMGGADEGEGETKADEPKSLRQSVMAARRAMDIKQRAKDKIEEKVVAPARMGTNYALRWAWMTLIPSFGLSLIYVNLHVFLKFVFGEKLFCKLGEEWISKKIQAVGGDAGKMTGKAIGIVEVMALLALDLAILFIIAIFLFFIVMIATWIDAGTWDKAKMLWGAGLDGVKVLVELFL